MPKYSLEIHPRTESPIKGTPMVTLTMRPHGRETGFPFATIVVGPTIATYIINDDDGTNAHFASAVDVIYDAADALDRAEKNRYDNE